jgi:hypothetical protein
VSVREKVGISVRLQFAEEKFQPWAHHLVILLAGAAALLAVINTVPSIGQTPNHVLPPGMTCPRDKLV